MAHVIMEGLQEYADLATEDMKAAVKKAGNKAKSEVQAGAPVKTGKYKKSWAVKTTKENANAMEVTVHSKIVISWHICLNLDMPSVVVAEREPFRISRPQKQLQLNFWKEKWRRH